MTGKLKPEQYEWMAGEIEAGNVPPDAMVALRDLDPEFAAWYDQRSPPTPAAPAAALPLPKAVGED